MKERKKNLREVTVTIAPRHSWQNAKFCPRSRWAYVSTCCIVLNICVDELCQAYNCQIFVVLTIVCNKVFGCTTQSFSTPVWNLGLLRMPVEVATYFAADDISSGPDYSRFLSQTVRLKTNSLTQKIFGLCIEFKSLLFTFQNCTDFENE